MKRLALTIALLLYFHALEAQPIPPDSGNSVTPISGIACLVIAGTGVGVKRLLHSKSNET
ncbi:MAG: hypothetical protein NXI09_07470 [Bacteroidetes bacterium]|nr:hypothetical protein [Bacteroidota bacterium]